MIGFVCHPLNAEGSVAMIDTPFAFADGDGIPVFVEKIGSTVRFFDDGGVIMHLIGRGVSFDDHRRTRFLKNIAEPNGVQLNDSGELEIWSKSNEVQKAFAQYLTTVLAVTSWEKEQCGVSTDSSLLLDEVAIYLQAWKPSAVLADGKEISGVTGHVYKMDFQFDGSAVLAIGIHPASVSSTAKKLLDIRAATENEGLNILVVMDDRQDQDAARREGLVLDSVGKVMMMTKLQERSRIHTRPS
ncbi:DUF1828 domain-containing protein [Massilia cavernae]|nr:DUF1828 domain-containing protein [Massilia cavernae]